MHEGETALVHAAAGGVGLLLVQIAKMRGASVIATVSTEAKAQLAKQAGVDAVYDSVGVTTFEKSLDCLRPRGYLALFGQSSGPVPPLDPAKWPPRDHYFSLARACRITSRIAPSC